MYSEEDIDSAVSAGVITEEAAAALRTHVAKLRSAPAVDEEHFRLITGFNDIFVVIACLLLLASMAWIGATWAKWYGALAVTVAAWGLGEFFIRKRRMALPAIVLLLAFVGGVLATGLLLLGNTPHSLIVSGCCAAIAAWFHWLRFHVPITVAAGTASLVGSIVAWLISAVPEARSWIIGISLIAGFAVFLLAMWWDASDTARQTRRSDVAFWLHLLAAPLLVHPVFASLGIFSGKSSLEQAIAVFLLYLAIAFISLCIDRRALMVSALIYVLYAFSTLLKKYGVVSLSFAITALFIGSALLLLSAFWHPSRTFILNFLPTSLRNRLTPLR